MKNMNRPIIGSTHHYKNITEIAENRRPKNTKNNPDKIIETVLLKIIDSPLICKH